jgi:methylmalonyl-CoA mutase N-terminal domain/subunit
VIAYETGVPDVTDPLGGSYFVESLTDGIEELAEALFSEIDAMGDGSMLEGVLGGIERGWFQKEIAESAFREQRRYESGELVRVGVNRFVEDGEAPIETLVIGEDTERSQVERVRRLRADRDAAAAERALSALTEAARGDDELIEPLVACARARCTEGEIVRALSVVFGDYSETPRI